MLCQCIFRVWLVSCYTALAVHIASRDQQAVLDGLALETKANIRQLGGNESEFRPVASLLEVRSGVAKTATKRTDALVQSLPHKDMKAAFWKSHTAEFLGGIANATLGDAGLSRFRRTIDAQVHSCGSSSDSSCVVSVLPKVLPELGQALSKQVSRTLMLSLQSHVSKRETLLGELQSNMARMSNWSIYLCDNEEEVEMDPNYPMRRSLIEYFCDHMAGGFDLTVYGSGKRWRYDRHYFRTYIGPMWFEGGVPYWYVGHCWQAGNWELCIEYNMNWRTLTGDTTEFLLYFEMEWEPPDGPWAKNDREVQTGDFSLTFRYMQAPPKRGLQLWPMPITLKPSWDYIEFFYQPEKRRKFLGSTFRLSWAPRDNFEDYCAREDGKKGPASDPPLCPTVIFTQTQVSWGDTFPPFAENGTFSLRSRKNIGVGMGYAFDITYWQQEVLGFSEYQAQKNWELLEKKPKPPGKR